MEDIHGGLEMTYFHPSFQAASVDQTDPTDVKVKLIAPPQYTLITPCVNKADGEQRLSQVCRPGVE